MAAAGLRPRLASATRRDLLARRRHRGRAEARSGLDERAVEAAAGPRAGRSRRRPGARRGSRPRRRSPSPPRIPAASVIGADQTLALGGEALSQAADAATARADAAVAAAGRTHALHAGFALAPRRDDPGDRCVRAAPHLDHARPVPAAIDALSRRAPARTVLGSVGCYQLEGLGRDAFQRDRGRLLHHPRPSAPRRCSRACGIAAALLEGLDTMTIRGLQSSVIRSRIRARPDPWLLAAASTALTGAYERADVAPDAISRPSRHLAAAGYAGGQCDGPAQGGRVSPCRGRGSRRPARSRRPTALARRGPPPRRQHRCARVSCRQSRPDARRPAGTQASGTAVVLGAGGAARAVVRASLDRGAERHPRWSTASRHGPRSSRPDRGAARGACDAPLGDGARPWPEPISRQHDLARHDGPAAASARSAPPCRDARSSPNRLRPARNGAAGRARAGGLRRRRARHAAAPGGAGLRALVRRAPAVTPALARRRSSPTSRGRA